MNDDRPLPAGLHITTWDDAWRHPLDRYAVCERGEPPRTFRTLALAKADIAERFGKVRWTKVAQGSGRKIRNVYLPSR